MRVPLDGPTPPWISTLYQCGLVLALVLVEVVGKYCMISASLLDEACLAVSLKDHASWLSNVAIFGVRVRHQISDYDSFVLHMPETTVLCDCSNSVAGVSVQF